MQPPFYPSEAEKKGATPSQVIFKILVFVILFFLEFNFQYGFVFGIAHLAAFLTAPIFGRWGARMGPKLLYNAGAFVQVFHSFWFSYFS